MSRTCELVGGSRDGTVITLPEGAELQWVPDGADVEVNSILTERYVRSGRITSAGHEEFVFMGTDDVTWADAVVDS